MQNQAGHPNGGIDFLTRAPTFLHLVGGKEREKNPREDGGKGILFVEKKSFLATHPDNG